MRLLLLAAALVLAAAAPRQVAPILTTDEARDSRSFARPEIARVTHVALDLDADFRARRRAGTATLDIEAAAGADEIILDSKGLEIQAVTDVRGRPLAFALGEGDERSEERRAGKEGRSRWSPY